jgi:hypothetical protein
VKPGSAENDAIRSKPSIRPGGQGSVGEFGSPEAFGEAVDLR